MKVLKKETGIGISSHAGNILSYESFPVHLQINAFGIVMGNLLSALASRAI